MSTEEFIRVLKPSYLRTQTNIDTPKRSKSRSRAKSVTNSSKKEKAKSNQSKNVHIEHSDVLNQVFNYFEDKISKTKNGIHQDLFESIYENTLEYFNFYKGKREVFTQSKKFSMNPICNVIPTIALYTGINVQDYSYLCEQLADSLRSNLTSNLFFINDKNSNNIKTLVNSIYTQCENIVDDTSQLPKRNVFTFRSFFELIKDQSQDGNASVIFFFKQFELIPKETIECFVSLISCYIENVAIYFIIELASQTNIINEQLSSNLISKLCIKKLYFTSPHHYMDKFLTQLFLENTTMFKLSGQILKHLLDIYNNYNYSISYFIHSLKLCFYDHLHENPLNALFVCNQVDNFDLYESIMDQIVHQNESNKQAFKSICKSYNSASVHICMEKIQNEHKHYNNAFTLMCLVLHEILKHFPFERDDQSLFGNNRTFTDLYVKMWNFASQKRAKKFTETDEYMNLKKLVQLSSANTINDIVTSMLNLIKTKVLDREAHYEAELLNDIYEFYETLDKMKMNIALKNCDNSFVEEEDELAEMNEKANLIKRVASANLGRKSSIRTLKPISENSPPKLAASQKENKPGKTKALNTLKANMIEWLNEKFATYFEYEHQSAQPFIANFCYANLDKMKKSLFDMQRINVHECLLNSFQHLNINSTTKLSELKESPRKRFKNTDKDSSPVSGDSLNNNPASLLPINVVYKLYLECGHMINLHDWLMAFVEHMEHADLEELPETKRKLLIGLFFRSITELQFMGFIKPTSRKVDHVVKLTNGSNLLAIE